MANNVVCVKGSTSIRGFHPSHPVVRGQFQPRSGDLGGLSSLPMAPELESQKSNPDGLAPEPDSEPQSSSTSLRYCGFFLSSVFRTFFFFKYPKLFSLRTSAPNLLTSNTEPTLSSWDNDAPHVKPPSEAPPAFFSAPEPPIHPQGLRCSPLDQYFTNQKRFVFPENLRHSECFSFTR